MCWNIKSPYVRPILAAIVLMFQSGCAVQNSSTPVKIDSWVFTTPTAENGLGPLNGKVFGSGHESLIVLLHGDVSRGGPSDYFYERAQELSRRDRNATVVALLRAGYYDSDGRKSPGNNFRRRDQYTAENNAAVAETIRNLKASIQPEKTIAIGHSGGAAQLGAVIGQNPGLLDAVLLLSCPCNLDQWQASRGRPRQLNRRSQSPSDFVNSVKDIKVLALTGTADDNTVPALANGYVKSLQALGVDATFELVPDAGHNRVVRLPQLMYQSVDRLLE